jgi:hypothetical protein
VPVTDAAKVLALDEDVDGLRALREALPAHLAVQAQEAGGERLAVEPVQQYVDEVTLPLVTGTEQNALLTRTQLAAERSRLDATLLYVDVGPSPANRLVLGYAEADRQRRVNPRTAASTPVPAARAWPRPTPEMTRPELRRSGASQGWGLYLRGSFGAPVNATDRDTSPTVGLACR